VVNIILRNNYTGKLIELNTKQRADGLFKNHTASATVGFGDLVTDGYNLLGSVEINRRDGVNLTEAPNLVQQELLGPLFGRLAADSSASYPGNLYTTTGTFRGMLSSSCDTQKPYSSTVSTPRCWFAPDAYLQYVSDQTRVAGFMRGTWAVNNLATVSAELMLSRVETDYKDTPTSRTATSSSFWADSAGNAKSYGGLILPKNHPDNPTRLASASNPVKLPTTTSSTSTTTFTTPTDLGLGYRFVDLPYNQNTQADNLRLVLSGSTEWNKWDVDAGLMHHIQRNTNQLTGRLSLSGLTRVLADGSYRFGGQNSPEVLAVLSPNLEDTGETQTTSLDLRGSRQIGQLDGGAAMLGLGTELRRESFDVKADPRTAAGDIIGRGISQATGSRNVEAAYAELQLPFFKGLETQAAARIENYSDFGSALTGKLGAKYKLNSAIAARGTFATGFRAPALTQITKSAVVSFSTVQDKKLCPVNTTTNENCKVNISSVFSANTDLQPERSKSYTLGLVMQPTNSSEVVLDGWYIDRKNEVASLSAQTMVDREADFPGTIIRQEGTGGTPGKIVQVLRTYMNLATSSVGGVDFDASYRWSLGEYGKLRASLSGTRMLTRKRQDTTDTASYQTLGFYGVPRTKGRTSLNWSDGNWSSTLTYNYQGRFKGYSATGTCAAEVTEAGREDLCTMKPWKTADLALSYKGIKGMRLSTTVRNLANSRPPFDPTEDTDGVYPQIANAYGRYFSVNASYEF